MHSIKSGKFLALLMATGISFVLVHYRFLQTGTPIFRFFWWNLLLAFIPWWCSEAMRQGKGVAALLWGIPTVLFLPNAPYMITDLFHLRVRNDFPLWYDTMLIFWFALIGVVLFYLSLFNVAHTLRRFMRAVYVEGIVGFICLLSGFGIYLGRYLRFNSWDVMTNYDELAEEMLDRMINLSQHTRTLGVTLLYGGLLLAGYWMVRLYRGERG